MKRIIFLGLAMLTIANTRAPLTGEWGGNGVSLTLDANGGQLEMDCADGMISQPVLLRKSGVFSAKGRFHQSEGGPQRVDSDNRGTAAVFSGSVNGKNLHLTMQVAGTKTAQVFHLEKGTRVKLHRCL